MLEVLSEVRLGRGGSVNRVEVNGFGEMELKPLELEVAELDRPVGEVGRPVGTTLSAEEEADGLGSMVGTSVEKTLDEVEESTVEMELIMEDEPDEELDDSWAMAPWLRTRRAKTCSSRDHIVAMLQRQELGVESGTKTTRQL